jgi:diguanylate cyclase (GGDEF)-like protein
MEETQSWALGAEALAALVGAQAELICAMPDQGRLMATAVGCALELTGAAGAAVALLDGDAFVYRTACGQFEAHLGLRLPICDTLSGLAISAGATQISADAAGDRRARAEYAGALGIRSLATSPLVHAGAISGVLKVSSPHSGAFGEATARTLDLLAVPLAACLAHAGPLSDPPAARNVAGRDALTGLPNRGHFVTELQGAIARARRAERAVGLLRVDLDDFGRLNALLGHSAGDAVLREVARRLAGVVRAGELCARYGEDEFAIVVHDAGPVGGEGAALLLGAIAARVREALAQPLEVAGKLLAISGSLAAASFPGDAGNVDAILARADVELAVAKRAHSRPAP